MKLTDCWLVVPDRIEDHQETFPEVLIGILAFRVFLWTQWVIYVIWFVSIRIFANTYHAQIIYENSY